MPPTCRHGGMASPTTPFWPMCHVPPRAWSGAIRTSAGCAAMLMWRALPRCNGASWMPCGRRCAPGGICSMPHARYFRKRASGRRRPSPAGMPTPLGCRRPGRFCRCREMKGTVFSMPCLPRMLDSTTMAAVSILRACRAVMLFRRMLSLILVFFLGVAQAQEVPSGDPEVLRIEPVLADGWLNIDADVHLPLSDELRSSAERGVTLYFTADIEIVKPRSWWFDKDVIKTQQTWRVVYNALTRQWRIGTGELSLPEPSLDDALSLV